MHRWVDLAEIPLIGRELAVGVQVIPTQQQRQLLLAKILIDQGDDKRVEGQVPGRVPGILPFVRHRQDVGIVQVVPVIVAGCRASD